MGVPEDEDLEINARKYLDKDFGKFEWQSIINWASRIYKIGFKHGAKSVLDDVRPEVHAHWVSDKYETESNTYKCSRCGRTQILLDGTPNDNGYNFCPNCGAKMDEETNEG